MHARATALLLALVACVPEIGDRPPEARAPSADPRARAGGTLVVAIERPGGIDPVDAADPAAQLVVRTACDRLIATDPSSGAPRPGIAASWTVADRGRRLFLRLRRDVRFPDGRGLVADDVAYSLSRLADEQVASPVASLLEPVSGYGFVHGEAEPPDERLRRRLLGVAAIDPYSLQITLDRPFADFFRALSHPATAIVPHEAVEADPAAFTRQPVCAGPYRFAEAWPGRGPIRLARVEGYTGADPSLAADGRGFADDIVFRTARDRTAALRPGADVARVPDGARPPGGRVVEGDTGHVEFAGLPTTRAPFDDPAVRVALSMAVNREAIAAGVFGGGREPARSFLPPGLAAAHRPGACGDSAPARVDVGAARAALERAGIDLSGVRLPFLFNDDFRNREAVAAIARGWERAFGLDVRPVAMPWDRYLAAGTRPQGIDGAFRFAWRPDYPSPDRMLAPLFHPDGIGRDNWSLYGSRDFEDAIRDGRRAVASDDRLRAYRRAEDDLCRAMPMIPVVWDRAAWRIRRTVLPAAGRLLDAVTAEPLLREYALRR